MVDPRISNITSGGTSVAPKDMSLKYPKGGDGLTVKQRMFVKIFSEGRRQDFSKDHVFFQNRPKNCECFK